MARIKVQQGLVILQAELNNGDQTAQSSPISSKTSSLTC
jgi:hypothetical protein